jgi:recombination protein RecR
MSKIIPKSVADLIDQFSELPGIGPKSASRLTFYLLHRSDQEVKNLGNAVVNLKDKIKNCPKCFSITDSDLCAICSDTTKDLSKIMVVESPLDIIAIEKTQEYNGLYHVLGGAISPVDGIGPEDIRINELLERLKNEKISEIILATNPDLEGEATAMYIEKQITNLKPNISKLPKITRIARGIPVGGDLEYADEITLSKALEGRKEY